MKKTKDAFNKFANFSSPISHSGRDVWKVCYPLQRRYKTVFRLLLIFLSVMVSACATYEDSANYILNPKAAENCGIESLDFYKNDIKLDGGIAMQELQGCVGNLKEKRRTLLWKKTGVREIHACLENKNVSVRTLEWCY